MRRYAILATTFLASPALAQAEAPFCGGISAVGEWVGGSEAASDVATAPAAFQADGMVPIAGHLVRLFHLSEAADIRAEVAAEPAGDPYISIYDRAGTEVGADDDSGGDFAARVEMTLPAGTYCLAARSYESGVTQVAVRIGRAEHEAMTAGGDTVPPARVDLPTGPGCFSAETPSLGTDLEPGGLEATATGNAGEQPAYGFDLAAPATLSILATSELGDPLITLLAEDGTELAENDDFDGLNSRIDLIDPLPAGSYCIEVEDLNGAANAITVSLQDYDAAAARARRIAAAEIAPGPGDPAEIVELGDLTTLLLTDVTASADAIWLRFDAPQGGLLLAEARGDGADPVITLFDRVGRQVGYNDDGPNGLDSQLAARLFPGSYLMAVRLVDEGEARISVALERFVPAE
ncbi:MAG: ABC transporter substrate-binding protein [Pseudomonadota bacterium]